MSKNTTRNANASLSLGIRLLTRTRPSPTAPRPKPMCGATHSSYSRARRRSSACASRSSLYAAAKPQLPLRPDGQMAKYRSLQAQPQFQTPQLTLFSPPRWGCDGVPPDPHHMPTSTRHTLFTLLASAILRATLAHHCPPHTLLCGGWVAASSLLVVKLRMSSRSHRHLACPRPPSGLPTLPLFSSLSLSFSLSHTSSSAS
jgi:hypothetical protein